VVIQTRSPLVLRDLDLLKESNDLEVGLSITTANDDIRNIFEPKAPTIPERLRTIDELHRSGLRTYVMIAPMLPEAEKLVAMLEGKVDYVIIDRLNYHYADWLYAKYGWGDKKSDDYFRMTCSMIAAECAKRGIDCRVAF